MSLNVNNPKSNVKQPRLRRRKINLRVVRFDEAKNEPDLPVPGTMGELIHLTWDLTAELCALGGKYDAQQRLQRHVARVVRS